MAGAASAVATDATAACAAAAAASEVAGKLQAEALSLSNILVRLHAKVAQEHHVAASTLAGNAGAAASPRLSQPPRRRSLQVALHRQPLPPGLRRDR